MKTTAKSAKIFKWKMIDFNRTFELGYTQIVIKAFRYVPKSAKKM